MKNVVISALVAACFASTVSAQEVPEPEMMMVRGAMLCDTEEELQTLITQISLNGGKIGEDAPKGCGRFVPRQPIPMLVTPLEWYETPMGKSLTARFYFMPNNWTQYGWVGYEINPDYKPEPEGEAL